MKARLLSQENQNKPKLKIKDQGFLGLGRSLIYLLFLFECSEQLKIYNFMKEKNKRSLFSTQYRCPFFACKVDATFLLEYLQNQNIKIKIQDEPDCYNGRSLQYLALLISQFTLGPCQLTLNFEADLSHQCSSECSDFKRLFRPIDSLPPKTIQSVEVKLKSYDIYIKMQKNIDGQQNLPLVQNVVSFAKMSIEAELDLKLIAQKVEGCRYNKKRFPAVIMRKTRPKSTILVFKSGRMIIIGSESQTDAEQAARKAIKDIQKFLNLKVRMADFHVTNIVANADLGWKIDIGKLCQERHVIRNQNFPGVVYKQMEHVKSALIFASGKVVFTGAKTKDSIDNAFTELKKKMQKFKKIT